MTANEPSSRRWMWLRTAGIVAVSVSVVVMFGVLFIMRPIPTRGALQQHRYRIESPDERSSLEVRLKQHVAALTEGVHPRTWDSKIGTDRALSYLRSSIDSATNERSTTGPPARMEIRDYRFMVEDLEQINLSVEITAMSTPPDAPLIIVGAHYDTAQGTPGADDNASGVAGVLELMKMARANPPADRRIEFAFFATEERPHFDTDFMGSKKFVSALKGRGEKPKMSFILEMIGFFTDAPNSQEYPLTLLSYLYPSVGDFNVVVGEFAVRSPTRRIKELFMPATDLPIYSIVAPRSVRGVDFSDHRSFWNENLPAVMITDTAFFRNPHYHKPTDTLGTLDFGRMAKVVTGMDAVIRRY